MNTPTTVIGSYVLNNTAGAGDAAMTNGQLVLAGITIPWAYIRGYSRTQYAAGTAQVTTLDTTAATLVVGTQYTVTLTRLDTNAQFKFLYLAPSTSVATYKTAILTAFTNVPTADRWVTPASTGANTMTLTEVLGSSGLGVGGFTVVISETGTTVVTGTAHVNASGTVTEVNSYGVTIAGGQYDMYNFICDVPSKVAAQDGVKGIIQGSYVYCVEKNDAQFAAFNTQLTAIMDGSGATTVALVMEYLAPI